MAAGLTAPLSEEPLYESAFLLASFMASGSLTAYWLRRDTVQYKVQWSAWWLFGMLTPGTAPLVYLGYFVKTRGWGKGIVSLIGLVALSISCLGAMFLGAYVSLELVP